MSDRPLEGIRVLVPRGGRWGDGVAGLLRARGADPVIAPLINFAGPEDPKPLREALDRLQGGVYEWLVVTSATTVDVFVSQRIEVPDSTRIAAVGETTAAALNLAGYRVDFVPQSDNSARGLVREWPHSDIKGPVLIPQSDIAEPTLVAGLSKLGFRVQYVTAYRTVGVDVDCVVRSEVASGSIGALLVTSGSVARQIAAQLAPVPDAAVVVCIGPRTAFDARAAGLAVTAIAEERSVESLIAALVDAVREDAP